MAYSANVDLTGTTPRTAVSCPHRDRSSQKASQRDRALSSVEQLVVRMAVVPLAFFEVCLVAGAYVYAVGLGTRNAVVGDPQLKAATTTKTPAE